MSEPGRASPAAGILYLVATPIGNLEDITLRALRVLREADLVAAEDTRSARHLLDHFEIDQPVVSYFEGNEAARAAELGERLAAGARVALISEAGTPLVSDPGARLVAAALSVGARVEPIPGPSAVVAALGASGLPTDRFLFFGFPPRAPGPRREAFARLRSLDATLVFYEAPGRVAATLDDLGAALGSDRPAALARELTKVHEEFWRGTLGELGARAALAPPRGEVTLLVAGAPAGAADEAVDLEAEVRAALGRGQGPREIAAALALRTGKPRRAIYQLALALGRRDGR